MPFTPYTPTSPTSSGFTPYTPGVFQPANSQTSNSSAGTSNSTSSSLLTPTDLGGQGQGFLKNMAQDPLKTLLVKPATRVAEAGTALAEPLLPKDIQNNIETNLQKPQTSLGISVEPQQTGIKGVQQIAGDAAKSASYLAGGAGGEVTAATQTAKDAIIAGAKTGAASGALYGAGNAVQQPDATPGSVAGGAATGAAIGGVTGGAINGAANTLLPKAANALQDSAEANYYKVLNPTTIANKQLAAKVAPGLSDRGVVVMTKQGLEDKATQQIQDLGQQISDKWSALPPETQVKTTPALQAIQDLKNSFTVKNNDGQQVVINTTGYAHAQQMEQTILSMGDNISADSMRQAKQILDGATYLPNKGVLKVQTQTESSLANAQHSAANAFRGILNDATPDIAKLNAEFNFWKNVQTVISATNLRTQGKTPLTESMGDIAGAAGGLAKGGLTAGAIGAGVMDLAYKVFTSAGWQTIGAQTKNALADALSSGNTKTFSNLATKIITNSAIKQKTTSK